MDLRGQVLHNHERETLAGHYETGTCAPRTDTAHPLLVLTGCEMLTHGSCLAGEVDDLDPEEPAVSICDGYFSWLRIVSLDPVFLCLSGVEFYGSLDRKRL